MHTVHLISKVLSPNLSSNIKRLNKCFLRLSLLFIYLRLFKRFLCYIATFYLYILRCLIIAFERKLQACCCYVEDASVSTFLKGLQCLQNPSIQHNKPIPKKAVTVYLFFFFLNPAKHFKSIIIGDKVNLCKDNLLSCYIEFEYP